MCLIKGRATLTHRSLMLALSGMRVTEYDLIESSNTVQTYGVRVERNLRVQTLGVARVSNILFSANSIA